MHFEQDIGPSEGLFDAQLALPLAGAAAPEPFSTVVKRDGRVEPFQTAKIAAAIMRASAATAPGEAEHAWDLAKAVRVHLWKQLGSETPHVDQVHEAVERVLVAMTRQRTALAYARYRARRARQRENSGAARTAYSSSLEEDDHAREALGGRPDALLVRTSADTLAAWDRGKITAALVRETGLRENTAEAIALEVEQQIAAARIESLTASLVRELVDAKLAEHGLGEYRERHRRLGVPLYDTALMMRGAADKAFALGPDGTDRVLARVLKKEYALAEVFSPTAAEAHLRGDLHICGLGEIDRYASARLPLGAMRANGWAAFDVDASPAHLLARWRQTNGMLAAHLQAPPAWTGSAEAFAPALAGLDAAGIQQTAEMIAFEFALQSTAAPLTLPLTWPAAPVSPACGRLFAALLDTLLLVQERGVLARGVLLDVSISAALFAAFPPAEHLQRLAQSAAAGLPVRFSFVRGAVPVPAPEVVLQEIALNLPRAARRAGELGGIEHWLQEQFHIAAAAHEEKRAFMEELWERAADGPLAALRAWDNGERFAPRALPTRIALDGLHEAAAQLVGSTEDAALAAHAEEMLALVGHACRAVALETGAHLQLTANGNAEVSQRFAALETGAAEAGPAHAPARFTSGIALRLQAAPAEAARAHGRLTPYLDVAPALEARLLPDDFAPESIAGLLQKVLLQTNCPAICFPAAPGA